MDAHDSAPNKILVGKYSTYEVFYTLSSSPRLTILLFKEFFSYLQAHGLYESDVLEDRVVFLFVFVPILRSEINTYVETWNEHRIRRQKHRVNHIAGIPNELYTDPAIPRYGWTPDNEFLSQLSEAVEDMGK